MESENGVMDYESNINMCTGPIIRRVVWGGRSSCGLRARFWWFFLGDEVSLTGLKITRGGRRTDLRSNRILNEQFLLLNYLFLHPPTPLLLRLNPGRNPERWTNILVKVPKLVLVGLLLVALKRPLFALPPKPPLHLAHNNFIALQFRRDLVGPKVVQAVAP